jgi:hypothetical protein
MAEKSRRRAVNPLELAPALVRIQLCPCFCMKIRFKNVWKYLRGHECFPRRSRRSKIVASLKQTLFGPKVVNGRYAPPCYWLKRDATWETSLPDLRAT